MPAVAMLKKASCTLRSRSTKDVRKLYIPVAESTQHTAPCWQLQGLHMHSPVASWGGIHRGLSKGNLRDVLEAYPEQLAFPGS